MIYGFEFPAFKKAEMAFIDSVMTEVVKYLDLPETYLDIFFIRSGDKSAGCMELDDMAFNIDIPKGAIRNKSELAAMVIHEMKHVEQRTLGKLEEGMTWLGKSYKGTRYEDQPWEIEAYAFENKMLKLILEKIDV